MHCSAFSRGLVHSISGSKNVIERYEEPFTLLLLVVALTDVYCGSGDTMNVKQSFTL